MQRLKETKGERERFSVQEKGLSVKRNNIEVEQ